MSRGSCVCRYMVLYWRGGVYADADCLCRAPVATWNQHRSEVPCSFFVGLENDVHFAQVRVLCAGQKPSHLHCMIAGSASDLRPMHVSCWIPHLAAHLSMLVHNPRAAEGRCMHCSIVSVNACALFEWQWSHSKPQCLVGALGSVTAHIPWPHVSAELMVAVAEHMMACSGH